MNMKVLNEKEESGPDVPTDKFETSAYVAEGLGFLYNLSSVRIHLVR